MELKAGIHLMERKLISGVAYDRKVSVIQFLKLLKPFQLKDYEFILVEGLDALLSLSPDFGEEVRARLAAVSNDLFNRQPTIVFAVRDLTLGESCKVRLSNGKEIDLHPIFGTLNVEGSGHQHFHRFVL